MWQDRVCRIELADLCVNFHLQKSILPPASSSRERAVRPELYSCLSREWGFQVSSLVLKFQLKISTNDGTSNPLSQRSDSANKTNPSVGIAKRSVYNQETSPFGLLSTIIRGSEHYDPESTAHGKIKLPWQMSTRALTMSTSACNSGDDGLGHNLVKKVCV